MTSPADSKIARKALRERLLALRVSMDVAQRAQADRAIAERLGTVAEVAGARTIGVYWPIRAEPDLVSLFGAWRDAGRVIALPVVGGPGGGLLFCRWDGDSTLLPGPYGIAIPREKYPVVCDCLVVPCIGFHRADGLVHRIGYGGGFYDRTLSARPTAAIGVAYDALEAPDFEPSATDAPLTALVTGSRVITSIASP